MQNSNDPGGVLTLTRTDIEIIDVPTKLVKPRRFEILATLQGQTWRRVTIEISSDEAGIASYPFSMPAPSLEHFGLPTPNELFGIALKFQIAQKLHASTDPHEPPDYINDRARDIVDLLLMRELPQVPLVELREACEALFNAREQEALTLGISSRSWPPRAEAFPHWQKDFDRSARDAGLEIDFQASVEAINAWVFEIESTR